MARKILMRPIPKHRHSVVLKLPSKIKPRMRRRSMSAEMQDGVVGGAGMDKASDNHCSLFTSSRKNRHGPSSVALPPLFAHLSYSLLVHRQSMKCLYSSGRSDATSSLSSSPTSHAPITFNAERVKQIPHLGCPWETLLFAHTAYFAIVLSVIMRLRGSPRYLLSGRMRRFSTRLSAEGLIWIHCQTPQSRSASANKEISFDLSLRPELCSEELTLAVTSQI